MIKAIILALAIALTLSLAACGGGGTSQSDAGRLQREIDRLQSELDRAVRDSDSSSRDDSTATPEIILPEIEENPVSDFEYKAIAGGIEITKYIGTPVRVCIPANIEGLQVTSIGEEAFSVTGIMEVVIPESVTNIGHLAFSGNEALTSMNIPDSVTDIGYGVFSGCTSLTSVNIPDSVTDIGHGVFSGCTSLTSVNIPDSVTSIGNYAFDGNEALTSIYIPDSVTSIGAGAFGGCVALTSINIPDSVTYIGRSVFNGCTSLISVDIAVIKEGGLIHFGGYFWRVLDVQGNEAFVISEDVIDSQPYHADGGEITWEHSSIRQYLNGVFLGGFKETDKARIIETLVINNDNLEYGTPGGNNTTDKIFLLSIDEANYYFEDDDPVRVALNAEGEFDRWWFRSPGREIGSAMYGGFRGNLDMGEFDAVDGFNGVRPALWLNLEP